MPWKLPDSRDVSAALDSHPRDLDAWDRAGRRDPGPGTLRYQRIQAENPAGLAHEQELAGYPVPVVNTSLLGPETCEELLEKHHRRPRSRAAGEHPHVAGFTEELESTETTEA